MKKIDQKTLNSICSEAKQSSRKRKNYNYHDELSDPLQRLLNALEPGTYIQPHKHEDPDKREVFIILTGKVLVITFNDDGSILDHVVLDQKTGNFGVEIPEKTWHSIISLEKNSVVFEVKDGPYAPIADKCFAQWAPEESEAGCLEYNENILKQLNIKI